MSFRCPAFSFRSRGRVWVKKRVKRPKRLLRAVYQVWSAWLQFIITCRITLIDLYFILLSSILTVISSIHASNSFREISRFWETKICHRKARKALLKEFNNAIFYLKNKRVQALRERSYMTLHSKEGGGIYPCVTKCHIGGGLKRFCNTIFW